MIRQNLDDDAKEAMTALHGAGLIHLAVRPEKDTDIKEATRLKETDVPGNGPIRLGIEKHGDTFALYVGRAGGPMKQVGATATLHLDGPFYVAWHSAPCAGQGRHDSARERCARERCRKGEMTKRLSGRSLRIQCSLFNCHSGPE